MISEHEIISLVEKFEGRIRLLNRAYADAKQEIVRLEGINSDLRSQVKDLQKEVKQVEKKLTDSKKKSAESKEISKLVKDNLSGTDTNTELKQQLDEYIRDLDRCIAHLSSLS